MPAILFFKPWSNFRLKFKKFNFFKNKLDTNLVHFLVNPILGIIDSILYFDSYISVLMVPVVNGLSVECAEKPMIFFLVGISDPETRSPISSKFQSILFLVNDHSYSMILFRSLRGASISITVN